MQRKLAVLQGAPQVVFQFQTAQRVGAHAGLVDRVTGFAAPFGLIHRRIRVTQKFIGVDVAFARKRDANRRRRENFALADGKRFAQRLQNALGHQNRVARGFDAFEQNHEFVAAKTRRSVAAAQRSAQTVGDADQQFVARRVAQTVVDIFEIVQVNENHRELIGFVAALLKRVLQTMAHQGAVGQMRQRIVKRLIIELVLQRAAFGHVGDRSHDAR